MEHILYSSVCLERSTVVVILDKTFRNENLPPSYFFYLSALHFILTTVRDAAGNKMGCYS